jgi:TetR/AcrR family transcriptional regulator, cholesterol catabolism regulator
VPAPPTRPALRERYERRRQEILRVAAHEFALRGYHATSMDDLSDATGLAAGGLYHYIGSKEQLLFAILAQLMDPLLKRAREVAGSPAPPSDRLRALLRIWLEHIEAHHDHMLVFTQERRVLERDERWKQVRESRQAFEEILSGLVSDAAPEGDTRLRVLALLGMVNHTAAWYRPGGRLSSVAIADGYWEILVGRG